MDLRLAPSQSRILALRGDVVATVLEDGAVLLDLQSKYFYALNGSAWSIVQCLEGGAALHDVEAFAQTCGASDGDGVRSFVSSLEAHGLLESVDEAGPALPLPASRTPWIAPTIERQAEPLQRVLVSAFDPSIPLAE